uniref:TrkH family potassium uptake protein n=1 Tax=Ignisphaera aggregans TaxID=334771 RepID=A0A7C2V9K0_9CREN
MMGLATYGYAASVRNLRELEYCARFLTIVVLLIIPFTVLSIKLWGNVVSEIVDAFVVVMIYWLLVPSISALIYWYTVGINGVDAFFESLSGFSGTGLSVLYRPEDYPYVILLWRALTQWIGELSVVVFSGALLPHIHRVLSRVYIAERGVKIAPTILSTTRRMLGIYVFLTTLGTIMLMYSGMGFVDAVAHSMTGIATGGMSTNSESITYWYRMYGIGVLVTSSIIMALGALNFIDLYNLTRGRIKEFVKSIEVRWFIYVFALLGFSIVILTLAERGLDTEYITVALYNMLSGLTTTGFQVGSVVDYPDTIKTVIIIAMAIGGATFSTAGGIKLERIAIAFKSIMWSITRPFLPEKAYIAKRLNNKVLEDSDIASVYAYITLYIVVAITASVMLYVTLCIHDYVWSRSIVDAVFEVISALSCVGLSTGITSAMMPLESKVILMTCMYLGRLEFTPVYVVAAHLYKRRLTL